MAMIFEGGPNQMAEQERDEADMPDAGNKRRKL
jgi:hypothetical protein